MYTIVLLTEEALTAHDVARVSSLHDTEPVSVHVLVPVDTRHNKVVTALDEIALGQLREAAHDPGQLSAEQARAGAETALRRSVEALQGAGVRADGAVVGNDPVTETVAAAQRLAADEVVVVTEPHLVETTFRRDWGSRLRSKSSLPVLHFVAGTDRVV